LRLRRLACGIRAGQAKGDGISPEQKPDGHQQTHKFPHYSNYPDQVIKPFNVGPENSVAENANKCRKKSNGPGAA
jgi:hypothetical protein